MKSNVNEAAPIEVLVSVEVVRRLAPLPDIGHGDVQIQLCVTTNRRRRWDVFVDAADLMKPQTVLNACVNRTGFYPKDAPLFQQRIEQLRDRAAKEVLQTITTGWAGPNGERDAALDQFVLPGRTIGKGERKVRFAADRATSPAASAFVGRWRGKLALWRKQNARLLGKSSLGITTLGAFLAAPLLPFADLSESMIVLLAGGSTTGKSTIQLGAMSFQGRATPEAIQSPQTSQRAWEELGANFNNLVLPIEDFGRLDKGAQRELLKLLAYNTVAGGGRTVSQVMQRKAGLTQLYFRTIGLAVSERNSNEIAEAVGEQRLAGEFARVLDLYAGREEEGGVFDRLEPGDTASRVAEELRSVSAKYYGTPLRAWIRYLRRSTRGRLRTDVRRRIEAFVAKEAVAALSSSAVFARLARKFGLLYAALMMGREAKIVPWKANLIEQALITTFASSCEGLGGTADADLVGQLVAILNDPDRCPSVGDLKSEDGSHKTIPREWVGIRDLVYAGQPVIGLLPKGLAHEWGKRPAERLIAELARRRLLEQRDPDELWQVRLLDKRRPRVHCLSPRILGPQA
jgi:hypothetical protein